MEPAPALRGRLARVGDFVQRAPDDGKPATQRTDAYFAYDDRYFYVIFVAFDKEPGKIRARLDRREAIALDEDQVGVYIDPFRDRRRAYQFDCNALGVQYDSFYSEDILADDPSFDTVWDSRGRIAARGFVVWMRIPFRSLRFPHASLQNWGILAFRWVGRRQEGSWWPPVTQKTRGFLSQEGVGAGFEQISPGRNVQLIPYMTARAFRAVDTRNPAAPTYTNSSADFDGGLDAKVILKDSLVLDITARPDFSQVEADDAQSTINQRYAVYFQELRPFFTENASYFELPLVAPAHLLFTRRIGDPDFGVKLTGRLGEFSLGALVADDKSPGEFVPAADPLAGKRAWFDALRISRDVLNQSNFGAILTERRFAGSWNRVLGLDTKLRLSKTWTATGAAVESWSDELETSPTCGHDIETQLMRAGRAFNYLLQYVDRTPGFHTDAGIIPRVDLRWVNQDASWTFWPKDHWFTTIKPELATYRGWDHSGTGVMSSVNPALTAVINHQTTLVAYAALWSDTLRPQDYAALTRNQYFPERSWGISASSSQLRRITLNALYEWGAHVHYIPPVGEAPLLANYSHAQTGFSLFASRGLAVSTVYLFDRNLTRAGGHAMFDSHIIQSKWNWQLNREFSLRFIGEYNGLLANPAYTSTPTARTFNADFLVTWLLHPGTAVYLGYNSDLAEPGPAVGGPPPDRFVNDGRQIFVKISWLFRP